MTTTHDDEGRIVKLVLAIDVDAAADELLTGFQIAMSTGHEELVKLGAIVEGVLVTKDAALDEQCFLAEFTFELIFAEDHGENKYYMPQKANE